MEKAKIWIIDDSQLTRNVLKKIIEENTEFASKVFESCRKAFSIFDLPSKELPDLILLDVMLPEIGGFEFAKMLKTNSKTSDIPIIFLTSLDDTENLLKGFELGGIDYISKDSNPLELLARLNAHIKLKLLQDEVQKDLLRAMKIQRSFLPRDLPSNIQVLFKPSQKVSGDLIYYKIPWVALIDVSGHGASSALISAGLRVILKEVLNEDTEINNISRILEERYLFFGETEMHFSAVLVKMNRNLLEIISLGHPRPILLKNNKTKVIDMKVEYPVGWGFSGENRPHRILLEKGDSVYLFSDGITEINTGDGFIGEVGLLEIIEESQNLNDISEKATSKNINPLQDDDISLIKISYLE